MQKREESTSRLAPYALMNVEMMASHERALRELHWIGFQTTVHYMDIANRLRVYVNRVFPLIACL